MVPGQVHLEPLFFGFWGHCQNVPELGPFKSPFSASVWAPKELETWPRPEQEAHTGSILCPASEGVLSCPVSLELGSRPGQMGLGQVWTGRL